MPFHRRTARSGVEGLALIRNLFTEHCEPDARIDEIRRIASGDDDVYEFGVDIATLDFKSGYARWSLIGTAGCLPAGKNCAAITP